MSNLPKSTKRRDLIDRFRELGWSGPHIGKGDHPQFMEKAGRVAKIPNKHSGRADLGEALLKRVLSNADISVQTWLGDEPAAAATADTPETDDSA